ncbi:hypothetical protein [Endozoicomonas sp. YOMI1]|nr:hypothetical protein [Endozoicomonas sp. YOMI1]
MPVFIQRFSPMLERLADSPCDARATHWYTALSAVWLIFVDQLRNQYV